MYKILNLNHFFYKYFPSASIRIFSYGVTLAIPTGCTRFITCAPVDTMWLWVFQIRSILTGITPAILLGCKLAIESVFIENTSATHSFGIHPGTAQRAIALTATIFTHYFFSPNDKELGFILHQFFFYWIKFVK